MKLKYEENNKIMKKKNTSNLTAMYDFLFIYSGKQYSALKFRNRSFFKKKPSNSDCVATLEFTFFKILSWMVFKLSKFLALIFFKTEPRHAVFTAGIHFRNRDF